MPEVKLVLIPQTVTSLLSQLNNHTVVTLTLATGRQDVIPIIGNSQELQELRSVGHVTKSNPHGNRTSFFL